MDKDPFRVNLGNYKCWLKFFLIEYFWERRLQGFSSKMNYVYKPSLSSPSNTNSVHKVLNDDDFYMGIFNSTGSPDY